MPVNEQARMDRTREVAERMGERAAALLQALDEGQRQLALLDFHDAQERTFWNYTPIARRGLSLRGMDRPQHQLMMKLLRCALSVSGYNTVALIMAMETVLDGREGFTRPLPGRDPEAYHFTLFGEPQSSQPWGWRFEGHHLSLHFTISEGMLVSPFPLFFGSNPAECELAGGATLRPLHDLEDHAFALFHALDEHQRHHSLLSPFAPRDILLGSVSKVAYDLGPSFVPEDWYRESGATPRDLKSLLLSAEPAGIPADDLDPDQRSHLIRLVRQYLERLPADLAQAELSRFGDLSVFPMHFAWAGGSEHGTAHYYRIQSPGFLIEFDNYQNDANHIHAVWRDPMNDFGADTLSRHYAHHH